MENLNRRSLLAGSAAAMVAAETGAAFAQGAAPLAMTRYGKIRGLRRGPVDVFLGVPYGAPTGGAARWLAPRPPTSWRGVRAATAFGSICPQLITAPMAEETQMLAKGPVGEDCLRLNIWTPAARHSAAGRAVMVWFHGGGFAGGSGNAASYDGANLAHKQDVVVVTVTHRLNHFGFMYLADLFGQAYADSGNVGMLDCVEALRWVRDNIAAFGGDPGRVTIFGQSGGGLKVCTLMGMPAAKGLFHRAIASSGAQLQNGSREAAAEATARLVRTLGVTSVAELQAIPAARILETVPPVGAARSGPIIDNRNIPAGSTNPIGSGLARDIPMIVGSTETESAFFGPPIGPTEDAALQDIVVRQTGLKAPDAAALIQLFRDRYPGRDNAYVGQLLLSRWTYTDQVDTLADRKAAQPAPVYLYYFTKHLTIRGGVLHAPHTSDVPYYFDDLASAAPVIGPLTPDKQALADKVSAYWANFAKTGDPNGAGLPRWSTFDSAARGTLVIDDDPAMRQDPNQVTRLAVLSYKTKVR